MEIDRYLTRRNEGSIWQARIPVPRRLHLLVGKREITKSLRTADKTEATKRIIPFVISLQRDWALIDGKAPAARHQVIDEHLLEHTAVRYAHDLLLADFDKERLSFAAMPPGSFQQYRDLRQTRLEERRQQVATGNLAPMREAARGIALREGWDLPNGHPLFSRFCELLAEANLSAFKVHIARLEGDIHVESADRLVSKVQNREKQKTPANETILALFDKYARSQLALDRQRPDTVTQNRKLIVLFAKFVGKNHPVSGVSKRQAREFRDALHASPISLSKRKAYRGLSLKEAGEKALRDGVKTLSVPTVAKHISTVSPFYNWLVRQGYADANPFDGLHPQLPREKNHRPPFTVLQLNVLLSSPLFVGFAADGKEHVPGERKTRDWRFWIPLACMFTGARISEIAQLRIGDVLQREGHWFIDLKEDGEADQKTKGRKNRPVAVHPILEKIGFIEFVVAAGAARESGSLFLGMKDSTRGNAGDHATRFFTDYLERINLKEKGDKLGSHSFRHLLADQLRLAGYMNVELGPLVLGHSSPATVTAGYGRLAEGTAERLHSLISAVKFEGVKFQQLMPKDAEPLAA